MRRLARAATGDRGRRLPRERRRHPDRRSSPRARPTGSTRECDVGQGDATAHPVGRRHRARRHRARAGRRCGAASTTSAIGRIDLLVLTHYDLDHVGGVDAVIGRVDRVLVGPSADAEDDAHPATRSRRPGPQVDQVARGERGSLGLLDWRVVWPPPSGVEPGNAASVTLLVTPGAGCATGCLSGLLLGDLGEESQARLLGAAALGPVDVVKVAHHGSADQSDRLYEQSHAPGRPDRRRSGQRLRASDGEAARDPRRDRHRGLPHRPRRASSSSLPAPSPARWRSGRSAIAGREPAKPAFETRRQRRLS